MMQAVRGEFRPNDEVDEICWAPLGLIGDLLTYDHELLLVTGIRIARADVA